MTPDSNVSFDEFFRQATGERPYAYQRTLGEMERPPSVLEAHTGTGKTQALIVSWLYGRRVRQTAPRRLVYALPMRSLVEQTASVGREIRERLELDEQSLGINVLMGGADKEELRGWREWPERDQIAVGTIDMLLSRALNRGYGESRYQWPISFGLLNNDCRWVFDEIQLMQSARVTAAQLDGLRAKLGVALPCETIWASATIDCSALLTVDRPELGETLQLPKADRIGSLKSRLNATKRLERADLTACKPGDVPRTIADEVVKRHRPATRSIVVLNRVDLAQQVTLALERHLDKDDQPSPEVVLIHSRFRPPERKEHMEAVTATVNDGPGHIIVATQVIEAGIDISSTLLATETAPFSSIVQRLGRCNRKGEDGASTVLWLDSGQPTSAKQTAPYDPDDIAATRTALLRRIGTSLSPIALEQLAVPERREAWDVLRRRDLLDLFDTSPDLSGMDVDVSRFIREDDESSVFIFFRELHNRTTADTANQPAVERDELLSVPLSTLGDRDVWLYDSIDDMWKPVRAAPPGATIMLAAEDGGYDSKLGWNKAAKAPVTTIALRESRPPEAQGGEEPSTSWMSLPDHLELAQVSTEQLVRSLQGMDLSDSAIEAAITAAAVHDIGKAHPAFQEMIRASAKPGEEPDGLFATQWAKSASRRGPRNKRRHFRHELASALALRSLDGQIKMPSSDSELVQYLAASHHGRVRLSIRPAPGELPPADNPAARFALGVHEDDELPAVATPVGTLPNVTLSLTCMELGGEEHSWVEATCALRDDSRLGPFRLGFLEALVRIADWRASKSD